VLRPPAKKSQDTDLAGCLLIEDHLERDACIIRAMEARIDEKHSEVMQRVDEIERKIDDIPTREEFEQQSREIQDIFSKRIAEAASFRQNAPEIVALNGHIDDLSNLVINTFQQLDSKIEHLDSKIEHLDSKIEQLDSKMVKKEDLDEAIKKVDEKVDWLIERQ
jgi:chromosome segregation ATPase